MSGNIDNARSYCAMIFDAPPFFSALLYKSMQKLIRLSIRCFFAVNGALSMNTEKIMFKFILFLSLCFITGVAGAMRVSGQMEKAVASGEHAAVMQLIDEGDTSDVEELQKTVLLMAARNNDAKLVKMLLDRLLERGGSPQLPSFRRNNNRANYSKNSPLYFAIEHGNESMLIALLDAGMKHFAVSDFPDNSKSTPIKHAILKQNEKIITVLKDRGARIEVSDIKSLFGDYIGDNDIKSMRFVLSQLPEKDQLALVNASTIAGEALTVYALRIKNREIFDFLISHGANIDNTNSRGERALSYAIENNDIELARFAIDKGAKKEFIYGYAHSPITSLQASVDKNNIEMVRLILSGCGKPSEGFFVKVFKRRNCEDLDYNNYRGIGTPLTLAANNKNTGIVRLLLEYGADPNVKDNNDNWLPAINSISKGDFDTFKVLMDAGTYLDNITGVDSAIRTAIYSNSGKILEFLLEKGVEHSVLNEYLNYALVDDVDVSLVKMLLDAGADAAWINRYGDSHALDRIKGIKVDALKVLVDAGLDVNVRGKKGETLLGEAIYWDRADLVDVLLEYGALDERVTPLHIAVVHDDLDKVRSLLNADNTKKSDLVIGSVAGVDSPLVLATANNHYNALEMFIEHGSDVNSKSQKGDTLLVIAIAKKYEKIVDLLLKNNASPDLPGYFDNLPLKMAVDDKDIDLIGKLLKSGADVFFKYDVDKYNSVNSPFYEAYFRCDKCLAVIVGFKYSRYLDDKVTLNDIDLNDVDRLVDESHDHLLEVLGKALKMKNKLLLKMLSAKIKNEKDTLIEHYKYNLSSIVSVFSLTRSADIDFEWQEYVFDTLPFVDKDFNKRGYIHSLSYNNSSVNSSYVTLANNRSKFPEDLIVMAIDVENEKQAIKILKASARYREVIDENRLRKLASEKNYVDLLERLKKWSDK